MNVEEAVDRVSIGWQLTERRPEESDYDPRGGSVIEISDDRTKFLMLRNARGILKTNALGVDEIDWSLAVSASESVKTNHAIVILIVRKLQSCKPRVWPRYLVKALYDLSLTFD